MRCDNNVFFKRVAPRERGDGVQSTQPPLHPIHPLPADFHAPSSIHLLSSFTWRGGGVGWGGGLVRTGRHPGVNAPLGGLQQDLERGRGEGEYSGGRTGRCTAVVHAVCVCRARTLRKKACASRRYFGWDPRLVLRVQFGQPRGGGRGRARHSHEQRQRPACVAGRQVRAISRTAKNQIENRLDLHGKKNTHLAVAARGSGSGWLGGACGGRGHVFGCEGRSVC